MTKYSILAFVLALVTGLFAAAPVYAEPTTIDLEKGLMCQCGECTNVLEICHCETAGEMRSSIEGMIEEGQTEQQILDYFVAQYGEKVLAKSLGPPVSGIPAAPTNERFDVMVWVLPFVGIAGGGAALYFILRRRFWKRKTGRRKRKAAK